MSVSFQVLKFGYTFFSKFPLKIKNYYMAKIFANRRLHWKHWVPMGVPTWILQKTSFIKIIDKADTDDQ